jgi:hypothetical protein
VYPTRHNCYQGCDQGLGVGVVEFLFPGTFTWCLNNPLETLYFPNPVMSTKVRPPTQAQPCSLAVPSTPVAGVEHTQTLRVFNTRGRAMGK